jgi:hypothetical protein
MRASFELTPEDVLALWEFHQRSSQTIRRQQIGCLAGALAVLMFLPALILLTTKDFLSDTALAIWPLLIAPLLFLVTAMPYLRWRTRRMFVRLLSEGQNKEAYGHCELEVGVAGLTETRSSGSTSRNWSCVERIVSTPSHLFVYTSSIEAYIIPRRAFSTDSDFQAFIDIIAKHSGVSVKACT